MFRAFQDADAAGDREAIERLSAQGGAMIDVKPIGAGARVMIEAEVVHADANGACLCRVPHVYGEALVRMPSGAVRPVEPAAPKIGDRFRLGDCVFEVAAFGVEYEPSLYGVLRAEVASGVLFDQTNERVGAATLTQQHLSSLQRL